MLIILISHRWYSGSFGKYQAGGHHSVGPPLLVRALPAGLKRDATLFLLGTLGLLYLMLIWPVVHRPESV